MSIAKYDLIIFDLDGTLAPSKSPLEKNVADLLFQLLRHKKVAVMSGGSYHQFETQFLRSLPASNEGFSNLMLLPTSGTRLYTWRGEWKQEYAEDFSTQEKVMIMNALNEGLKLSGYERPARIFGEQIEDRGSQITFSALGQNAPLAEKSAWDPDRRKRESIKKVLQAKLPSFEVRLGGTTSIDITKRGVNKGYGIRKLEQFFDIAAEKILFIGDSLFYGGNDYPARAAGVDCIEVKGPDEVAVLIQDWLIELKPQVSPNPR